MSNLIKKNLDCLNCQTLALSVFCTLKRNDLEQLNQFKTSLLLKKGSVIFYENNYPAGLYCIHQGKAKVTRSNDKGEIQISRLVKDGDIIGYKSLLTDEPYNASAETIEDSIVCFIPKSFLMDMLHKNMELSLKLMSQLSKEVESAEQKTLDIIYKSTKERLAEALLLLKESFGIDISGFLNIRLTRDELASITGMAVETVVRLLKDWEESKIIELDKKAIKIVEIKELAKLTKLED